MLILDIFHNTWEYLVGIDLMELSGLVFGLLCVIFLIRQNILTWPTGITYVLISFVIFWQQRLYGDLLLHVFFLILNIYGWYFWVKGKKKKEEEVPVTNLDPYTFFVLGLISVAGIYGFGLFLETLPKWIEGIPEASLPYWDSTTSVLSVIAMWLTARKKIENWIIWLIVDILATGIYFYKGIEFYAILYMVYIGLAISGYMVWKKSMELSTSESELQ